MNRLGLILRQKIFIIVFVLLAVIGGVVIYWYVSRNEDTVADNACGELILIASCDIEAGTEITETMLEYKGIPENAYSEKFIISKEEILGKKTGSFIAEGEIISAEDMEDNHREKENYLKFSSYIPAGFRAVSVPVNYYGDAPLISSGDMVDVISTFYDRGSDFLVSETVLTGKEIILIEGQNSGKIDSSGSAGPGSTGEISVLGEMFGENIDGQIKASLIVITLYLRPEEVERIFLAMESGVLNISICPGTGVKGF